MRRSFDDLEPDVYPGSSEPAGDDHNSHNKKTYIAAAVILVVLLIAAAGILLYKTSGKREVLRAVRNLDEDLIAETGGDFRGEERESFLDTLVYGNSELTYRLDLSGLSATEYTIGFDGTVNRDNVNRILESENAISVMNYHLADIYVSADKNIIDGRITGYFEDSLTLDTDHLGRDYNASELPEMLGIRLPGELGLELFATGKPSTDKERKAADKETVQRIRDMRVSQNRELVQIQTAAGESFLCRVYHIEFPDRTEDVRDDESRDDRNKVSGMTSGGIAEYLSDGVDLYIDETESIRRICSASPVEKYGQRLMWRLEAEGNRIPSEILTLTVNNADNDDEFYVHLEWNGTYYSDADTFSIDCDRAVIRQNGSDIMRVKGSVDISCKAEE